MIRITITDPRGVVLEQFMVEPDSMESGTYYKLAAEVRESIEKKFNVVEDE